MNADQITRLEDLRDRLIERALIDADPANWVAGEKVPKDMSRDERGDAKWCRGLAINTVALTMQVQKLLQNPQLGGAVVPDKPAEIGKPEPDEAETVDAEIARYEEAAAAVLKRASTRGGRKR